MTVEKSSSSNESDDRYAWQRVGQTYQWPASRLTRANMRKLTRISNYLRRPINQVIVDAVEAYSAAIIALLPNTPPPLDQKEIELMDSLEWSSNSPAPRKSLPDEPNEEIPEMEQDIDAIATHIQVLLEAVDKLREQIDYLVNLPQDEPRAVASVAESVKEDLPSDLKKNEARPWQPLLF
jgi:hypothetical protein